MTKLYIIGNGFDLHHGLDTRYSSFGKFLYKNYNDVYESLIEYYGFEDVARYDDDELWSVFEQHLAELNLDLVIENHSDYLANPSSPGFSDRDWGAFSGEMEMLVQKLTVDLFKAFNHFIFNVQYNNSNSTLSLDKTAKFLNFNYTKTLQAYYGIQEINITYIHGKAEDMSSELILGHGIEPESFKEEEPEKPEGLSDQALEAWEDQMADRYEHSLVLGKDELSTYFTKTFKDTNEIINDHQQFFSQLNTIDEIFILGHSLSSIDLSYFEHIVRHVSNNIQWTVSYYSLDEKQGHSKTLLQLGIKLENIALKLMTDIH